MELILTLHDGILKGGEHGAVSPKRVIQIKANGLRAQLPIDNDDHMLRQEPRNDRNGDYFAASWIAAGATFDRDLIQLIQPIPSSIWATL